MTNSEFRAPIYTIKRIGQKFISQHTGHRSQKPGFQAKFGTPFDPTFLRAQTTVCRAPGCAAVLIASSIYWLSLWDGEGLSGKLIFRSDHPLLWEGRAGRVVRPAVCPGYRCAPGLALYKTAYS
eukprot:894523-Pelagomonas_calceolata.AAC.1